MTTDETTPKEGGLQVRELVKPQKQFTMLHSDVEALCSEFGHACSCWLVYSNQSPDEDTDMLF